MSAADTGANQQFHIGQRLSYDDHLCTVRYVGPVDNTRGDWLGVEWDDAGRGKHGGRHAGVRYFACLSYSDGCASFVRPTRPLQHTRTFLEALKEKYAPSVVDESADVPIRISGKEVEEVGFAKIDQQLRGLSKLKVVLLDGMRIAKSNGEDSANVINSEIAKHCESIVELDLSRNQFESLSEVADSCRHIPSLRSLRLNGNRFSSLDINSDGAAHPFELVASLELEGTLLTWVQMQQVCMYFPKLLFLNASANQFTSLSVLSIPNQPWSLVTLNLSLNNFQAISDLNAVSELLNLQTLIVNHGILAEVTRSGQEPRFSTSLQKLELAFNNIKSWSFVNKLSDVFPGLSNLRISHNPLYQGLQTVEGQPVSHENSYLLTVARLPRLNMLNYSQITKELQHGVVSEKQVVEIHPRYQELCEVYGRPDLQALKPKIDPNSLGASLLQVTILDHGFADGPPITAEIPKRFSIYSTIGFVAQKIGVTGDAIELYWLAEQLKGSIATAHELPSVPWDSDDEDAGEQVGLVKEVRLWPSTKSIGNIVDQDHITLRAVLIQR